MVEWQVSRSFGHLRLMLGTVWRPITEDEATAKAFAMIHFNVPEQCWYRVNMVLTDAWQGGTNDVTG